MHRTEPNRNLLGHSFHCLLSSRGKWTNELNERPVFALLDSCEVLALLQFLIRPLLQISFVLEKISMSLRECGNKREEKWVGR